MSEKQVGIRITAKDGVKTGVDSAISSLKKLSSPLETLEKKVNVIKNIGLVQIFTQLGGAIKNFAISSINAFSQVEMSTVRLKLALEKSGGSFSNMNSYIADLAKVSNTSQTDLLKLSATLAQLGRTEPEIQKLMNAANSLSNATGQSISETWKQVNATMSGSVDEIGKLIPELRTLTKEQLANGEGLDLITKKLSDYNDLLNDSITQKNKNLADSFSNIKEAWGGNLAHIFSGLTEVLTEYNNKVAETISMHNQLRVLQLKQKEGKLSIGEEKELLQLRIDMLKAEQIKNLEDAKKSNAYGATGRAVDENQEKQLEIDKLTRVLGNLILKEAYNKPNEANEPLIKSLDTNTKSIDENTKTNNEKDDDISEPITMLKGHLLNLKDPLADLKKSIAKINEEVVNSGKTNPSFASQVNMFSATTGISNTTTSVLTSANPLFEVITKLITSFESIMLVLDPIGLFLDGMVQILEPFVNAILAPIIGVIKTFGQMMGHMLILFVQMQPWFYYLTTALKLVADGFLLLYNKVFVPFHNGVMFIINKLKQAFIGIMNGIIGALNKIPFVNISKLSAPADDAGFVKEISKSDLTQTGYDAIGATSSSNNAAYTGGKNIVLNFYNQSPSVGDEGLKKMASLVRGQLLELEAMGI